MRTGLFYHPEMLKHNMGFGHPECPERLTTVLDYLRKQNAIDNEHLILMKPSAVEMSDLERVHPKHYIDFVHTTSDREGRFDSDTSASKGSYNAALLAAGAGIKAWHEIQAGKIDNAFALVRPPGHHANSQSARGFCLFNNISVLARHITATIPDSRVFIVDIDAHHGNGTQEIHYEEPDVFYFGVHQDGRTLYPGYSGYSNETGKSLGKGMNVNLPLPPGTTDKSFFHGFRTLLPPLVEQYQPTAILVSAGYDAHHRDHQTGLQLTATGYLKAAQLIMEMAQKCCQGKLVVFLEGGYDHRALAESVFNTLTAMTGHGKPVHEKSPTEDPRLTKYLTMLLKETKKILRPWWTIEV